MIDIDQLDSFSRDFFEHFSKAFPALADHAVIKEHSLSIEFAPDPARPDVVFGLWTDNDEVTIGFDQFHMHFDWPADFEDWQSDPLAFVDALLRDQIVIEVWRKAGQWSGSSVLEAARDPDLSGMCDDNSVTLRSWSGRLDRVIDGS